MKYVNGTFGFTVEDEAVRFVENITGAMYVQIDENVVEHDDNLNERSIQTDHIHIGHEVLDMVPVDVVSWVYYNGDESGGGGFVWEPVTDEPDHDATMRQRFDYEVAAWQTGTAVVRLVRILVPNFGTDEAGRTKITAWIDADIDRVESPYDPEVVLATEYIYGDQDGWRALMKYILSWRKVALTKDVDVAAKGEIEEYLRTYGPEDPPDLAPDDPMDVAQALVETFPVQADKVMHELASTPVWSLPDDKVDDIISAAEKADGLGRWHYAGSEGAACGAGDEAFTTGNEDLVTCATCKRLLAQDQGLYVGALAPFTKLIDAVFNGGGRDIVDDVDTGETGGMLLLISLGAGYVLGVSDYTETYWEVYLYLDREETEGELFIDVTESIGHVEAGGEDDQAELGRRIVWYLRSDQHRIDVATLAGRREEGK